MFEVNPMRMMGCTDSVGFSDGVLNTQPGAMVLDHGLIDNTRVGQRAIYFQYKYECIWVFRPQNELEWIKLFMYV